MHGDPIPKVKEEFRLNQGAYACAIFLLTIAECIMLVRGLHGNPWFLLLGIVCVVAQFWLIMSWASIKLVGRIFCPHCDKMIRLDHFWECGHCEQQNRLAFWYSILTTCQHCKREPQAYICENCNQLIYLTTRKDSKNPARLSGTEIPVIPTVDTHEVERQKRAIEREQKEHELKMARLQAELAKTKPLESLKPTSVRERLRSKVGSKTELDDEVRLMKAEADEKFKNDPIEREKQHRIIEDEARDLLR